MASEAGSFHCHWSAASFAAFDSGSITVLASDHDGNNVET
jgi:hypothetical protein